MLPLVFQWPSSGLLVCSNYASQHWIATGTPVGASISQCGSSGIPVYLWLQWSSSVFQLCKLCISQCGSSVICQVVNQSTDKIWLGCPYVKSLSSSNPLWIQLVWRELFLSDFFWIATPTIQNYYGVHIQSMLRVMLKYSLAWRTELVSIAEQYTPSKILNLHWPVDLLLVVLPSWHFKLAWMLPCLTKCWCVCVFVSVCVCVC